MKVKGIRPIYYVRIILLSSLFFCGMSSTFYPTLYTNKTFFFQRPHNFYTPIEKSLTKHLLINYEKKEGGAIQLTPILQFSRHGGNQGRYFLFGGENTVNFGVGNVDIDHRYFKFNETSPEALVGTLTLKPEIQQYGLRFDYYQDLSKFIPHLALKIGIPLVYATAKTHHSIFGTASSQENKTVADYFKGEAMWQATESDGSLITLQQPLRYGKFDRARETLGVANIDFAGEYVIIDKEKFNLSLSAHLLIPTDTNPNGEWLFQPTIGTADHWALMGELEGVFKVNPRLQIIGNARWAYVFANIERRVLGLKNQSGKLLDWGQYLLVGKVGFPFVLPAANILAHDVKVATQNQIEGTLFFSYERGGAMIEGGYNVFARQKEYVRRKSHFSENTYAFVGSNFVPQLLPLDQFGNPTTNIMGNIVTNNFSFNYSNLNNTISQMNAAGISPTTQGAIKGSQLDATVAQTPGIFTNGFFLAGGYCSNWKTLALTWGGGFEVEFPFNNAALMQNSVWLKLNLLF